MKTLLELYKSHTGKVSDKWALYLREYDRLFAPYRDEAISLLEIGVQNGGSLEIWSQYFPNAQKIVGCDINPDCAKLTYENPRIAVIVGDATTAETQTQVLAQFSCFDLIIEDGSHTSIDIVKAFAKYFPVLKSGGLFVAEDLHCSYWQDYEGGIFHPYSSITFFKHLADMVNHEHWGIEKSRTELIAGFNHALNIDFDEIDLSQISSVEFINSICVVRKHDLTMNSLGSRVIAGNTELVVSGHLSIAGTRLKSPIQTSNIWSNLVKPPAENYQNLLHEINMANDSLAQQCAVVEQLNIKLEAKQAEVRNLNHLVSAMKSSKSWRLTAPLRSIAGIFQDLGNPVTQQQLPNNLVELSGNVTEAGEELKLESASFEVLSGLVAKLDALEIKQDASKLIAFYLPQYHKVAENSEWWGPGFTEWTNVVKGRPNYEAHYQPHLPRELGFYDLSNTEVMREQAEMAKIYGVGAFCFYYYWFSGRRILEKPTDNFLNSDINMPYCLCWANENWTRTWDGDNRSVLLEQKYLESDPLAFIQSVMAHFMDKRYLKVDGKPMLVVYRAKDIPNVTKVFRIWREAVKSAGFPDLHIAAVDFYDISHPDEVEADALVEFPPHKFNGPNTTPDCAPKITNHEFCGHIVDYAKVMAQSANRLIPDFTLYRGVVPSWDNTARRQNTPTTLHGASPELFEQWLRYLRAYTREIMHDRSDNFIFINAWNEWGEGCHLEPDQKYGLRYLEAVLSSSWHHESTSAMDKVRQALISKAADSIRVRDVSKVQSSCLKTIKQELEANKTAPNLAHKIAFRLRNYPIALVIGKYIYKTYLVIWRP
jgi:hypothetical protein